MSLLTPTQQEAIERATMNGGIFYRWPRGEWRLYSPDTVTGLGWSLSYRVSTATINALRRAGYAVTCIPANGAIERVKIIKNNSCIPAGSK